MAGAIVSITPTEQEGILKQPKATEQRVTPMRFIALLHPYRRTLLFAGILLIITSGLSLVFPLVIRGFLNSILGQRDEHLLVVVSVGLLVVFVVFAGLSVIQNYLITSIGERLSAGLRQDLFRHLQALPLTFFDQRRTGELMSRVTNDVTVLQNSLTNNILPIVSQALILVGSLGITAVLNWHLTLIVLAVGPVAGILAGRLSGRIREATLGVQEGLGESGVILEEVLSAPRVVKAFTRERFEEERFSHHIGNSLRQALRRAWAQSAMGPIIGFVGFVALVIILFFGGQAVIQRQMSTGDLIAFLFYLMLIISPLISLTGLYSQIQAAYAAAGRIFWLLDVETEPVASALPHMKPIRGRIEFDHVSFTYPHTQAHDDDASAIPTQLRRGVLRNIHFTVQPGELVALVGPSGAGKTTTLNLLLRLYDINAGAIRIDGTNIGRVDASSLREQMAIVPQEPTLFGVSIAENIRYGRLDASDAEVREAARQANALGFIEQHPEGFNALVGERGVKLSAGQRQRLAIARAILRNPRILLLDEATASLDNESEALVQNALDSLMVGRTTIVVAHRLTTIEKADRILVLNEGRIVEQGTHSELLARDELYARLYLRNFASLEASPQREMPVVPVRVAKSTQGPGLTAKLSKLSSENNRAKSTARNRR